MVIQCFRIKLFRIKLLSKGHATSIIKHFLVFFSITTISGLQCSNVYPLEYRHPKEFLQYHFQWHTQPYTRTTFHMLLLHSCCIRPNGCSNIPYRVFSCTLSVLTYCNHSLCAEHSPHVFYITYIYLRHSHDTFF